MVQTISFLVLFILSFNLSAASGKFSLFLKNYRPTPSSEVRDIYVYIPGEYSQNALSTYPVLYMHDGQNLFDPSRAFLGQTWRAESTLNQLISQGLMAPVIVVAIDNTKLRTFEYTQDQDLGEDQAGGGAEEYLTLITHDLKPRIDASFRTKKDRLSTGMMGSSLGGLVSLYAGLAFSKTFGRIGALSPSIWWNQKSILRVASLAPAPPHRLYLDSGDAGGEKPRDLLECADVFKLRGMVENHNLKTIVQPGAVHSEKFWAQRLPVALQFLYPPN